MSRFESWTRGSLTGISSSRVAPGWVRIGVVVCLSALVLGFGALRSGELRGGIVLVGLYGLLALFLRTWLVVTAQTRERLVAHPELSDARRFAALAAVLLGIPFVVAILGVALLFLLGALDGIASGQ